MTALSPTPGASAMGKFAPSAMRREARAEAAAVAATTAPKGIPAAERMAGLAKRMYAMVRKVAAPPRTSRATVVPRPSRSKSFTKAAASFGPDLRRHLGTDGPRRHRRRASAAGDRGSVFAQDLRGAVAHGEALAGVQREHATLEAAARHLGEQAPPGRAVLGAPGVVGLEMDGHHRRGADVAEDVQRLLGARVAPAVSCAARWGGRDGDEDEVDAPNSGDDLE